MHEHALQDKIRASLMVVGLRENKNSGERKNQQEVGRRRGDFTILRMDDVNLGAN